MICRHCGKEPATRARGLGSKCYYTPGVRDGYPPLGERGRYGALCLAGDAGGGPPPGPTAAPPGTPEKVAVLAERAALRCGLWHPDDGRRS